MVVTVTMADIITVITAINSMSICLFKKSLNSLDFLNGITDRHSHILYGVDDGISDSESSIAVLSYLEERGLKELWLTPHVMEDLPNTTEFLQSRFKELKQSYTGNIELKLAAEYMIDSLFVERLHKRDILTMEDNMVLLECSSWRPSENWLYILETAISYGYRPVLAHVERYSFLEKKDYEHLCSLGVLMQLNYSSLTSFYGDAVRDRALWLLRNSFYSFVGSDCHRLEALQRQLDKTAIRKSDFELLLSLKN